jgi:hypothetical protein
VISARASSPEISKSAEKLAMTEPEFKRMRKIKSGLQYLKRYFMMIAFQCFLDQTSPEAHNEAEGTVLTFKQWMDSHEEFYQMIEDMENGGMESLVPVEQMSPGDGIALTTEVIDVVNRRFVFVRSYYSGMEVCWRD